MECSSCAKDHGNASVQHCDTCNQPQDQPGYTCRECSRYISEEEQARDRVNSPDYWVVNDYGNGGSFFNFWKSPYNLLSTEEDTGRSVYVCPWEEVKHLLSYEERNKICTQWAESFQAL